MIPGEMTWLKSDITYFENEVADTFKMISLNLKVISLSIKWSGIFANFACLWMVKMLLVFGRMCLRVSTPQML